MVTTWRRLVVACTVSWLIVPQIVLACELPPTPGANHHRMYVLDPRESAIGFDANTALHAFTGTAGQLSGRIRLPSVPLAREATGCEEIQAASLTTENEIRDNKMRTNHLHTDRFPIIRFTLNGVDQVQPQGADHYTAALHGNLALHGVTMPLVVPVKVGLTAGRLTAEGTIPLRLATFQIPLPSLLFVPTMDEATVRFAIVAVPE
jgi:polyisoprenoid-binding protein YceI